MLHLLVVRHFTLAKLCKNAGVKVLNGFGGQCKINEMYHYAQRVRANVVTNGHTGWTRTIDTSDFCAVFFTSF